MGLISCVASRRISARADKVNRLKQAKQEAEAEIMAYRQMRDEQFQKYQQEVRLPAVMRNARVTTSSGHQPLPQHMGDSGTQQKKIEQETEAAMRNIQISMDANKEKIITSLLQSVTTVSI